MSCKDGVRSDEEEPIGMEVDLIVGEGIFMSGVDHSTKEIDPHPEQADGAKMSITEEGMLPSIPPTMENKKQDSLELVTSAGKKEGKLAENSCTKRSKDKGVIQGMLSIPH